MPLQWESRAVVQLGDFEIHFIKDSGGPSLQFYDHTNDKLVGEIQGGSIDGLTNALIEAGFGNYQKLLETAVKVGGRGINPDLLKNEFSKLKEEQILPERWHDAWALP